MITLDSAMEIQGFSLAKFGQILLDGARIWLDLDLPWSNMQIYCNYL